MTAEGHLIFCLRDLRQKGRGDIRTDHWRLVAHYPGRIADFAAARYRPSQIDIGPAPELDRHSHRSRLWPPRLHPQPAGDHRWYSAIPVGVSTQLANPSSRTACHDHRLFQSSPGRHANPRRRAATVELPLLNSHKGNQLERAMCLCLVAFALYWQGGCIIPIQSYFGQKNIRF